jgi:hypothetical protein
LIFVVLKLTEVHALKTPSTTLVGDGDTMVYGMKWVGTVIKMSVIYDA